VPPVVEPHPRLIRAVRDPWVAGAARSSPTATHIVALRAELCAVSGCFWKTASVALRSWTKARRMAPACFF